MTPPHGSASDTVLEDLHAHLRAADPLLGAAARPPAPDADRSAGTAAGPAHALTVEAAREGQLVHVGAGRVVDGADADLAILAGDHLYAHALGRLAAAGDLAAVAVLAEAIAACAQAHAEGAPERARAAWSAAAVRIAAR